MWILPLLVFLIVYAWVAAGSPQLLLYGGIFCIGIGFLGGIPLAVLYHSLLFKKVYPVAPEEIKDFRWALDPRVLHRHLDDRDIPKFDWLFLWMIRCWYGAMGGCLLIFLWLLLSYLA